MRQLRATGWMHNRCRMIVASFLAKDLLIDWRWAASTGTDAQPWFRIFNPTAQGERFDPEGQYVRRWVPELAAVPARWIHNPWDLPDAEATRAGVRLGSTYAERVVIHAERRPLALAMYGATRP
jgi:deoxyribodipyrimidine photo-lyase